MNSALAILVFADSSPLQFPRKSAQAPIASARLDEDSEEILLRFVRTGFERRIKRGSEAKTAFKHEHPCPSSGRSSGACPGYVIDHVQALKHGGSDTASNTQSQTKAEAKAKERIED